MDDINDEIAVFRIEVRKIREENMRIGTHLKYVDQNYSADLKWAIKTVLYWLKSERTPLFRNKKKQKAFNRKIWHEAAEVLGLKHFTIEYTQNRYFCTAHKKYCTKWKISAGNRTYDSDHECSDSEKLYFDDRCEAEERIMERRDVYIISPEITIINDVGELEAYLQLNG